MSVILGITAFHPDSAACLVVDGVLKAAIAEERLGDRQKHCPAFPANAIRRVLHDASLDLRDVTHVAIARDPRANLAAKARRVLGRPMRSMLSVWEHLGRNRRTTQVLGDLAEICGVPETHARFATVRVEHHLAHIASAYYLSPFESLTAGFSYDASGDYASAMAARCEGTRIEVLDRVLMPHSMGFFYTALCQYIGFDEFGEEYKVMGLAPYGEDRHAGLLRSLLLTDDRRWFRLADGFFGMNEGGRSGAVDERGHICIGRLFSDRMVRELGEPRLRGEALTQREKDIARSCQTRFEEVAVHCLRKLHSMVPTESLAMAGGCALNGVANARLLRDTPFRTPYLQSAASDDGTCMGAAYWCYHNVAGGRSRYHMRHAYWGPEYDDTAMRDALVATGLPVVTLGRGDLLSAVTRLLRAGRIVGWYQGRSEWGPRALGNRSILADPTVPSMKDVINAKIKRRESFRPFAPTVLRDKAGIYFEQTVDSPFMMHVVKFRPEWRERVPAVVHVDGTGRLQTLAREQNPLYYDLISRFAAESGVHMLLNTSFNENEPIVDTPAQAVDCFMRTEMDALCLGPYLVCKQDVDAGSKGDASTVR